MTLLGESHFSDFQGPSGNLGRKTRSSSNHTPVVPEARWRISKPTISRTLELGNSAEPTIFRTRELENIAGPTI